MPKTHEVKPASLADLDRLITPFEDDMIRRAAQQNHDCGRDNCEDCTFNRLFP